MALLRLEATDDEQDRVGVLEAEALAHARRGLVVGMEASHIAAVVDHDDLMRRQPLLLDEVSAIGLRDRDVLVHETTGEAVHGVARLQATAPVLPHVRCLDDQRYPEELADRRGKQARIEEV